MRCTGTGLIVGLASVLSASCSESAPGHPEGAVVLGALLPFSGSESAVGRNLEQAMLLAVDDVNAAGGLDGTPFDLRSRDSHSSFERGLYQILALLYTDEVDYLIGPEENDLAREIATDVKALDVFHMLPGYAAPSIARSETRGGWMRLAPTPFDVGCALAQIAVRGKVESVNSLAARDDYHVNVSSEFTTQFVALGGRVLPSVTFASGEPTYETKIESAFDADAGRTLLAAYPATASTIVTEWTVSGRPGTWLLGPALRSDVLLTNIPAGSLDTYLGISPSLSLRSECRMTGEAQEAADCTTENAAAFIGHFARRWDGEAPLPAAHFYYDGVVLIAMGLVYAQATGRELPLPGHELKQVIRELNSPDNEVASWRDLKSAMEKLRAGTRLRYAGAAAEYEFDGYGANLHYFMQRWTIDHHAFADLDSVPVTCRGPR
ncbi:ABC transporter substrate-binding protein [Sorangium sp. So ce1097]|uniref:ABC transporter substrate-binding protein n=1 Tax=Sorangium sp. So ce1097 TaxID=3133330 RepID=UPI003F5DF377